MFPAHHLVTITLAEQAAPDEGAQDALAYLGLYARDGGGIQVSCGMEAHARYCISRVGCIANLRRRLKHAIHHTTVEVGVFVQA